MASSRTGPAPDVGNHYIRRRLLLYQLTLQPWPSPMAVFICVSPAIPLGLLCYYYYTELSRVIRVTFQ